MKMIVSAKSSIRFSGLEELPFSVKISKFQEHPEKPTKSSRKALLLYELFAWKPG